MHIVSSLLFLYLPDTISIRYVFLMTKKGKQAEVVGTESKYSKRISPYWTIFPENQIILDNKNDYFLNQ